MSALEKIYFRNLRGTVTVASLFILSVFFFSLIVVDTAAAQEALAPSTVNGQLETANEQSAISITRDWHDMVQTMSGILTTFFSFLIAFLVYLFTAKQAQNETLSAVQQMWQQLNFDILTDDKSLSAYRTLFSVPSEVKDEDVRLEYMSFIWLNILYLQWQSMRKRLIGTAYVSKSLSDQFKRLRPREAYILQLLSDRGYDDSFIKFVEKAFKSNK